MAVYRTKSKEIPPDAVILSPDEAVSFQWRMVTNWEPKSDVWALRYTPGILGGLSAFTGICINNYFRGRLKLGNYGRFSTYLPIVVIPSIASIITHRGFIQKSIILDTESCPICTQFRATAIQIGLGIIYPTVLAPFAALMFATRHYTYRLPQITENPKEVFKLLKKMGMPIAPYLTAALIGQSLVAMYLTYKEMMQYYELQLKLQQVEKLHENDA